LSSGIILSRNVHPSQGYKQIILFWKMEQQKGKNEKSGSGGAQENRNHGKQQEKSQAKAPRGTSPSGSKTCPTTRAARTPICQQRRREISLTGVSKAQPPGQRKTGKRKTKGKCHIMITRGTTTGGSKTCPTTRAVKSPYASREEGNPKYHMPDMPNHQGSSRESNPKRGKQTCQHRGKKPNHQRDNNRRKQDMPNHQGSQNPICQQRRRESRITIASYAQPPGQQ